MKSTNTRMLQNHEDVLEAIARAIDIPEHLDQIARERYRSIGEWLDREGSTINQYEPEISPQGSFLLGTVIRPLGDADEFDIDLVCTLQANKREFSMAELKAAVGLEIIEYAKACGLTERPEDRRRCWTLEYADDVSFHMDILPALPDQENYRLSMERGGHTALASNRMIRDQAVAITDKTLPQYRMICNDWPVSNPKGYAVWFRSRQSEIILARKLAIMESERVYASVDEVPDHKVKTPLQRAIQLLKRHRDSTFEGDHEKPISIIITTLSAHAYNGETTIGATLRSILKNMHLFIKERNGVTWVENPVNPDENFADKWQKTSSKEAKFFNWLERARHDFGLYLAASAFNRIPSELTAALSDDTVGKISPFIALSAPAIISPTDAGAAEVKKVADAGGATKPWRR